MEIVGATILSFAISQSILENNNMKDLAFAFCLCMFVPIILLGWIPVIGFPLAILIGAGLFIKFMNSN